MGTLQERIKLRREFWGLTLEEIARIVHVSRQTIQRYENGIIGNIPSDKIELLAKALHTTPAYLMGWEDEPLNDPEAIPQSGYFLNDETAAIAQEIYDNPDLRLLFHTNRNTKPEDLRKIIEMSKIMSGGDGYEDEA